jgi:hypothetical protein
MTTTRFFAFFMIFLCGDTSKLFVRIIFYNGFVSHNGFLLYFVVIEVDGLVCVLFSIHCLLEIKANL